jgi:hypothetical protein
MIAILAGPRQNSGYDIPIDDSPSSSKRRFTLEILEMKETLVSAKAAFVRTISRADKATPVSGGAHNVG